MTWQQTTWNEYETKRHVGMLLLLLLLFWNGRWGNVRVLQETHLKFFFFSKLFSEKKKQINVVRMNSRWAVGREITSLWSFFFLSHSQVFVCNRNIQRMSSTCEFLTFFLLWQISHLFHKRGGRGETGGGGDVCMWSARNRWISLRIIRNFRSARLGLFFFFLLNIFPQFQGKKKKKRFVTI